MQEEFSEKLNECSDFTDIFELVKEGVEETLDRSRAGLMLGLSNMGGSRRHFLGAYYPVASNIIVMNTFPIKIIEETNPKMLKPYVFHILLHEYLHSLGYLDEATVRELTFKICTKLFGEKHLSSKLARDISAFLPQLSYPGIDFIPEKQPEIFIVKGFDKGNLTYIS